MKLRAPAIPLITIDPYFSVWSYDDINQVVPFHWTAKPNTILGTVNVDGTEYRFWGVSDDPVIPQTGIQIDALSTTVTFQNEAIRLTAVFTSPLLIEDLYYTSRPVSYLSLQYESLDGKEHQVSARITASEELVLNEKNMLAYSEWNGNDLYEGSKVKIISPVWYQNGKIIEQGYCEIIEI